MAIFIMINKNNGLKRNGQNIYLIMNMLRIIGTKLGGRYCILALLVYMTAIPLLMAAQNITIIDDRTSNDIRANSGNAWYLLTDGVMGGVSRGQLSLDTIENRPCLRMRGDVSLKNNGGFIQIVLDLSNDILQMCTDCTGVMLEVYGNDEQYNVHLRTQNITFPWQSYRASFTANSEWKTLYLPFVEFVPYRIDEGLDISQLTRIGIVAIGRKFTADLCIGKVGLYR